MHHQGIAGLSAAVALQRVGHRCLVLEGNDLAGSVSVYQVRYPSESRLSIRLLRLARQWRHPSSPKPHKDSLSLGVEGHTNGASYCGSIYALLSM